MRSVEPRLANKGTLPVAILLLIFLSTEIFAQDYLSPIEGALVQREGAYSIYIIYEGKKYYIPPDMRETLGYSELPVQTLPQGEFDSIPEGQDEWLQTRLEEVLTREAPHLQEALREGSLIKKEEDYKVYIVHEGKKYLVTDIKALEERTDPQGRHYSLHEALELSPQDFDAVPKGKDDWFKDFFLKKEPVVRKSPEPKNYPTYT
ncbi:MAG: hypothetical protein QMD05_10145, partial [Candidatus Brocadiaceae bacterium]|nr:hypothetical protein [Candidatus Brocadiaceae bacterium]